MSARSLVKSTQSSLAHWQLIPSSSKALLIDLVPVLGKPATINLSGAWFFRLRFCSIEDDIAMMWLWWKVERGLDALFPLLGRLTSSSFQGAWTSNHKCTLLYEPKYYELTENRRDRNRDKRDLNRHPAKRRTAVQSVRRGLESNGEERDSWKRKGSQRCN